jgi:integrase
MGVKVREKDKDSGVYWVFINYKGKRTSRQIGTLKAANRVKEQIEARLKLGQDALPKEKPVVPTLQDYWDRFQETYLPSGVRESTMDSYKRTFKNHVLTELGNVRLDELTREKVKAFVASLVQKRYAREVKIVTKDQNGKKKIERKTVERPLSRASIRIIVAELTAVLNHAKEDGIIAANPAGRMGRLYRQAPIVHEEIQPLTHAEVPVFLDTARVYFPEYFPLFLCAIHTGMRSGELAGLQWSDIDFNGEFLTVRRNVTRGRIEKTKTDQVRRVDMSDALIHELQALKRKRQADYLAKGKNEIPEWVFLSNGSFKKDGKDGERNEGQRLEMYNVKNRYFLRTLEKAGLRRIRFHDLRHTFASLLIQNGESLAYVKDQLGHTSIKMTVDVYGHLVPGANRAAVNRLPTTTGALLVSRNEQHVARIVRSAGLG